MASLWDGTHEAPSLSQQKLCCVMTLTVECYDCVKAWPPSPEKSLSSLEVGSGNEGPTDLMRGGNIERAVSHHLHTTTDTSDGVTWERDRGWHLSHGGKVTQRSRSHILAPDLRWWRRTEIAVLESTVANIWHYETETVTFKLSPSKSYQVSKSLCWKMKSISQGTSIITHVDKCRPLRKLLFKEFPLVSRIIISAANPGPAVNNTGHLTQSIFLIIRKKIFKLFLNSEDDKIKYFPLLAGNTHWLRTGRKTSNHLIPRLIVR